MVEEETEGNEQNGNDDREDNAEVETEEIESTDDNVIEAYTGKWQPNGTIQEGPHTTNYDDGSQDRIEIKQAVMSATGLGEDLTEHWIGKDRKSTRLNSSHVAISYAVFCLKKKKTHSFDSSSD